MSCGFAIIEGYESQGSGEETSYRGHQQDLLNGWVWGKKKIPRGCPAAADPSGLLKLWTMLVKLEVEIDFGVRHVGSVRVRWTVKNSRPFIRGHLKPRVLLCPHRRGQGSSLSVLGPSQGVMIPTMVVNCFHD